MKLIAALLLAAACLPALAQPGPAAQPGANPPMPPPERRMNWEDRQRLREQVRSGNMTREEAREHWRAQREQRGLDFQKLAGEERRRAIGELGRHLMAAVGRIVPVVPVPLIASVFLIDVQKKISELELKSEVEQLIVRLEAAGAHVYIPRKDLDYAVTVGLRMLTLRRLVEEKDGLYAVRNIELPLIRYYANSIAHLMR